MSVVKLRTEIERAVRDSASRRGIDIDRPAGIGNMLRALRRRGPVPASTDQMLDALQVMHKAAHGMDVDSDAAKHAVEIGTVFLAELKAIEPDD